MGEKEMPTLWVETECGKEMIGDIKDGGVIEIPSELELEKLQIMVYLNEMSTEDIVVNARVEVDEKKHYYKVKVIIGVVDLVEEYSNIYDIKFKCDKKASIFEALKYIIPDFKKLIEKE